MIGITMDFCKCVWKPHLFSFSIKGSILIRAENTAVDTVNVIATKCACPVCIHQWINLSTDVGFLQVSY